MNNNARYDRSTNFLELEVNVPRTIGIPRDDESVYKKNNNNNNNKKKTKKNRGLSVHHV